MATTVETIKIGSTEIKTVILNGTTVFDKDRTKTVSHSQTGTVTVKVYKTNANGVQVATPFYTHCDISSSGCDRVEGEWYIASENKATHGGPYHFVMDNNADYKSGNVYTNYNWVLVKISFKVRGKTYSYPESSDSENNGYGYAHLLAQNGSKPVTTIKSRSKTETWTTSESDPLYNIIIG